MEIARQISLETSGHFPGITWWHFPLGYCWIQKEDLDQKRISLTMLRVVSFPFFLQLSEFL